MLDKFLRDVVVVVVGKPAEPIAELLNTKKHVNEFIIAKKLDITINQTRNILYRLSDHGLVSSIRKKDKKKGWYTYFWKIELLKSLEFLKSLASKRLEQINNQIRNSEVKQYYVCERCNIEFNEETAMMHDFSCNECGAIFTVKDKTKDLKILRRDAGKLERELELIEVEVVKEQANLDKSKAKILKKLEKEKDAKKAERKKMLAERRAAKKKAEGETVKKVVKKKVKKKVAKKKTATPKGLPARGKKKVVKKSK